MIGKRVKFKTLTDELGGRILTAIDSATRGRVDFFSSEDYLEGVVVDEGRKGFYHIEFKLREGAPDELRLQVGRWKKDIVILKVYPSSGISI